MCPSGPQKGSEIQGFFCALSRMPTPDSGAYCTSFQYLSVENQQIRELPLYDLILNLAPLFYAYAHRCQQTISGFREAHQRLD